jgi:hypothetical protein
MAGNLVRCRRRVTAIIRRDQAHRHAAGIWLFANSVFTLHAHAYYASTDDGSDSGGLEFPGTVMLTTATSPLRLHARDDLPDFRRHRHRAVIRTPCAALLRRVRVQHRVIAFAINVLGG